MTAAALSARAAFEPGADFLDAVLVGKRTPRSFGSSEAIFAQGLARRLDSRREERLVGRIAVDAGPLRVRFGSHEVGRAESDHPQRLQYGCDSLSVVDLARDRETLLKVRLRNHVAAHERAELSGIEEAATPEEASLRRARMLKALGSDPQ